MCHLQWHLLPVLSKDMRTPKNLYQLMESYLHDRKIVVNYAREANRKETSKGCVQGSINGPNFWNVILNSQLNLITGEGVHC